MTTRWKGTEEQLCTFEVGSLLLGIPVEEVQEVLRYQRMTRVPLAPAPVSGLINLRGRIVAAVDLRKILDLPPLGADALPMNVVLRHEGGGTSLLVDEIGDVVDVPEVLREPPPETLSGVLRKLVVSVYKLERRLLIVIDPRTATELGMVSA